jgi:hypothetical protein
MQAVQLFGAELQAAQLETLQAVHCPLLASWYPCLHPVQEVDDVQLAQLD